MKVIANEKWSMGTRYLSHPNQTHQMKALPKSIRKIMIIQQLPPNWWGQLDQKQQAGSSSVHYSPDRWDARSLAPSPAWEALYSRRFVSGLPIISVNQGEHFVVHSPASALWGLAHRTKDTYRPPNAMRLSPRCVTLFSVSSGPCFCFRLPFDYENLENRDPDSYWALSLPRAGHSAPYKPASLERSINSCLLPSLALGVLPPDFQFSTLYAWNWCVF